MSVYFAESCGYMKIGYSADPVGRAVTITRSGIRPVDVPFDGPVDLIGWVPGDVWREHEIQSRFIDARVAGEWFRLDRKLAEDLIWADPRGIDLHRMTAASVFACLRFPGLTRADIEASGVRIMAAPAAEVDAALDAFFDPTGVDTRARRTAA